MTCWLSKGPIALVSHLGFGSASQSARQQAVGSHPDIHLISQKLAYCQKEKNGVVIRGVAPLFIWFPNIVHLAQRLIRGAFPPILMTRSAAASAAHSASSALPKKAWKKSCFSASQQKWHLSYRDAFFDWTVINTRRSPLAGCPAQHGEAPRNETTSSQRQPP